MEGVEVIFEESDASKDTDLDEDETDSLKDFIDGKAVFTIACF
jgi:hypothetical protein